MSDTATIDCTTPCLFVLISFLPYLLICFFPVDRSKCCRVLESLQYLKVLSGKTFYLVDLVMTDYLILLSFNNNHETLSTLTCWWPWSQTGIVTRRPLVLQLHRLDEGREYAEFGHLPRRRFTDFGKSVFHWN